ncbi:MAG: elongation factor P maturation arginine rhamnosyltransferase EarP [Neisseria sp.]|uniref:elongation factor P maturation arginine rhamnosyltransferase EarP n=1 Tax=Neisseria sp. TaxID=192066 RepID=UPI0026DB200C|nr:elongation factor P maturation arginine rhamnosyltransferase EarP [Neisseria sp.]MDO4640890.1 elongation factor P maturation arginine rhamnosyltransferase EarP [Neisseria sp.]
MQTEKPSAVCWLFCTVIDNFGDIGISWRLAQILSREHGIQVHLWLDNEEALRILCPDLPPLPCRYRGIYLRHWQASTDAEGIDSAPIPDWVIETFACDLPESVLNIMRQHRPLWLNWEYLSAEHWAEAMHAKPSPQTDSQQKYFWLMGFTERSGGLLREHNYCHNIDTANLRKTLMLPQKSTPEWLLFGYESPIWARWLQTWQQNGQPLTLFLAGNQITESLRHAGAIPKYALQNDGDVFQTGIIKLIRLPFLPQDNFDSLLHLCDGVVIRGEDSFVRAQYAAKPFFWFIYPQSEDAHIEKLHAFWQKATATWPQTLQQAHQLLSDELNGALDLSAAERLSAWQSLMQQQALWCKHAELWRASLFAQNSATEKLVAFAYQHGKLPNHP